MSINTIDCATVIAEKKVIPKRKDIVADKSRNRQTSGNIKVLYTNADQFPNKKDDLLMFIAGKKVDIIMVTEMIPKQQKNVIPPSLLK